MKLKLTRHFQDMMSYRGIDIEHVKVAVNNPDTKENLHEYPDAPVAKKGKKISTVEWKIYFGYLPYIQSQR